MGANHAGAAQTPSSDAKAAALLAYLCRARADLPAARWAAERSGDAALLEALLIETADWKAMAQRYAARPNLSTSIEDLGFAAAYHRMAGDEAGARQMGDRIVAYADRRPDDNWLAAESLFLNDRPDDGMAVLLKHRNYSAAAALRRKADRGGEDRGPRRRGPPLPR